MKQVTFRAFVCAVAGVLAWLICEPMFPKVAPITFNLGKDPRFASLEIVFTLLIGMFVGLAAGWAQGAQKGGRRHTMIGAGLGLVLGAVGGTLGHSLGSAVFQAGMAAQLTLGATEPSILVRTLGIAPVALCIGAAIGATTGSWRGFVSGAIGGLVGGFVCGVLFNPVSSILAPLNMLFQRGATLQQGMQYEVGAPGRAVTALGTGLCVGLFTAWFDQMTRQAWLRLVLGRNEGKEWPVDAAQTLIGRDERAHVPLFGDPNVAPLHAIVLKHNGAYWLQDPGTPIGVGFNGQRIQGQAPLTSGDTIQVGSHNLQFLMRSGRAARVGEARSHAYVAPAQPAHPTPVGAGAPTQTSAPTQALVPQAPASAQGVSLLATSGPLTGQRFEVVQPLELGREAAGVTLGFDAMASRRHAALAPQADGVMVTDLGSTNGTFVNGQRIQSFLAHIGDTLTVGATTFRLEGRA